MDDAKLEVYIKNRSPDAEFSADDLKVAIDAMKELTPEQLDYMTKNTPT